MTDEQQSKPGPSRKAIIGWTAVMLATLGVAYFVGAVLIPSYRVFKEVGKLSGDYSHKFTTPDEKIESLGGPAEAVKKLDRYLRLPGCDQHQRVFAVKLFGSCLDEPLTVPILTRLLSDSNDDIRYFAAYGLGECGVRAQGSTPALEALLGDEAKQVRQAAAEALKKIKSAEPAKK